MKNKQKQNKKEPAIPDFLPGALWDDTKELCKRLGIPARFLTRDFRHGLDDLFLIAFNQGHYRGYNRGYNMGEKDIVSQR